MLVRRDLGSLIVQTCLSSCAACLFPSAGWGDQMLGQMRRGIRLSPLKSYIRLSMENTMEISLRHTEGLVCRLVLLFRLLFLRHCLSLQTLLQIGRSFLNCYKLLEVLVLVV